MSNTDKFTTPTGILSFPHLFKPNSFNEKEKYEATILVSKADEDKLKVLKAAVVACAKEKWGKHPKDIKNFQSPFKSGNTKFSDDEEKYAVYEDTTVLACRSEYAPAIVDHKREEILIEEDIYAGCKARASINLYPWEFQNKKGVGFGLQAVQKCGEGEKLGGGRPSGEDLFEDVEVEESSSEDGFGDFDV